MRVYVIIGVCGSGKTTIGKTLANVLGIPFYDADDFHPEANILKMSEGQPLRDADRKPWLMTLNAEIGNWIEGKGGVLACSALKESYRLLLANGHRAIQWIALEGSYDTIFKRMQQRQGHFMPPELLRSQFADFERPNYGWHVEVSHSPQAIVEGLVNRIKAFDEPAIGLIGLGVMGKSLARNMLDKGFNVVVYNRDSPGEEDVVSTFVSGWESDEQLSGTMRIAHFMALLPSPRRILCMVPAGHAVDSVLAQIEPWLEAGDVFMDGGNAYYQDTNQREKEWHKKGIRYLGLGVSGGEEGALRGPSLMPGGDYQGYKMVEPVLLAIAARDKVGAPCCSYIGRGGAGHFVKMIHNGIEYAEMQLLAEVYALLRTVLPYPKMVAILEEWQSRSLGGFLLESTITILKHQENGSYVLDDILDKAGSKGTGSWSAQAALELGVPATMLTAAMYARSISSRLTERLRNEHHPRGTPVEHMDIDMVESAFQMARILNHIQGFSVLAAASEAYGWSLNLSEIARVWTNGCIIRSELMEALVEVLQAGSDILANPFWRSKLQETEEALAATIHQALRQRIHLPVHSAGWQYWLGMTTGQSSANMIQAQRDLFGAHRYQKRGGSPNQTFHTKWTSYHGL